MATNTTEALYLIDKLDDSEFSFSNDTDDLHLTEGGFVPSTCTIDGGVDSFTCWTDAGTSTEDILAAENNINKWLEKARERYLAGRKGVYLVFERYGQELNRRARVRGGTCLKGDHSSGSRAAGSVSFTITIDHDAPECDERFIFQNLVKNPSFEYDTDDDGLANNWTDLGTGAPTFLLGTTAINTYHGNFNQRWNSSGVADEGLYCDNIAVTSGTIYAYGFHGVTSGSGDIVMEIRNSATHAVLDTLTLTNPSTLTRARDTWTASLTGNIYLAIYNNATAGQQNIDCVWFWEQNTYTGQQGSAQDYDTGVWTDFYIVHGHDDWMWDNANGDPEGVDEQNSTNRETIDMIDFQGTLPPRLELGFVGNTQGVASLIVGLLCMDNIGQTWHSFQAEDATLYNAAAAAAVNGASGDDGAGNNCVDVPLAAAATYYARWFISNTTIARMAGKSFRAFIVLSRKATSGTLQWGLSILQPAAISPDTPTAYYDADFNANWKLVAGPTITFPLDVTNIPRDHNYDESYIYFYGKEASGYDIYLDRLILVPIDGYVEQRETSMTISTTDPGRLTDEGIFYFDATTNGYKYQYPASSGSLSRYRLEDNEIRFWINTDDEWTVGAGNERIGSEWTIYFRPRYHSL